MNGRKIVRYSHNRIIVIKQEELITRHNLERRQKNLVERKNFAIHKEYMLDDFIKVHKQGKLRLVMEIRIVFACGVLGLTRKGSLSSRILSSF